MTPGGFENDFIEGGAYFRCHEALRCGDVIKAPVPRLGLAALPEEDPQGRPRIREQKAFQVDVYACLSSQQLAMSTFLRPSFFGVLTCFGFKS